MRRVILGDGGGGRRRGVKERGRRISYLDARFLTMIADSARIKSR